MFACASEGAKPSAPPPPAPAPIAAPAKPQDPADENFPMPALPMGRVSVKDAFGGNHVVEVEVAATALTRTRGLMWRKELADGKGMLFLFPAQTYLSFWMRNTLIPLDMIFIDEKFVIVGIVERAEPKTTTSRFPGGASKYVLEVPGGWSEKNGLKPGGVVKFEGTQNIAVTP